MEKKDIRICVIGLGYVGLPLARLFSTKYPTVGFDMNAKRCEALMAGHDATLEVSDELTDNCGKFDACIAAVAHREFADLDIPSLLKSRHVLFDVKATRPAAEIDARL